MLEFLMYQNTLLMYGLGTLRLLEQSELGLENKTRIYQASTSEFMKVQEVPQTENSFLSALTLCRCKNVCLLDYCELP